MSLTPVGDLGIALKSDVDDFHKGMRTSKESVGLFQSSIRGLSAAMRNMGIVVTAASAASGAAMVSLSRRAERVNSAFREVNSISSEVTDTQEEYGDLVSRLNTEFGLQASRLDIIDGLYQSVSAGVDEGVEAQEEFLETSAKLAAVGLVDLETTVDVLSTSINAYGEETGFAEEAASALFQTVQFGKVTLDELAPVMGRITALGGEMDVSIQELGASMAVLTRTGFEARVAATGLRAILRSLMRPSEEMQEILRDIALDQDLFAEAMGESADSIRGLAQDYRNATEELRDLEEAQQDVRREISEQSLVIQEARLLQTAIERDQREEAEDTIETEKLKGQTYEELGDTIDDYAFKVESARVEEEQMSLKSQSLKNEVEELEEEFSEAVGSSGDLEGGLGQLVLENEGLVDTLVELRTRADEQGQSFDELFPRTRALQGALALVGEDGSLLMEIFDDMKDGTIDAEEAWSEMDETARDNFDSFEEFQDVAKDMETFDLDKEFDDIRGEEERMQDATSRLAEAAENLGQVFNEEVTQAISSFGKAIQSVVDNVNEMDDSTRENVGRFAVLATSIGLVLGPMLLLGGQIALITGALGVGLLPVLGVITGVFALLAAGLSTAVQSGEESENMFESLENVFSGLVGILQDIVFYFNLFIAPSLIEFGNALISIFGSVSEELGGSAGLTPIIATVSKTIGDLISSLAEFLTKNEDTIVALITLAVDTLANQVIPPFIELIKGVWQVTKAFVTFFTETTAGQALLAAIVGPIILVGKAILFIVESVGKFMQRFSTAIGYILGFAAAIGVLIAGSVIIAARIAAIVVRLVSFIGRVKGAISFVKSFHSAAALISNLLARLSERLLAVSGNFGALANAMGSALQWMLRTLGGVKALAVMITGLSAIVSTSVIAILSFFQWLKEKLVGNSVIPEMMEMIKDVIFGGFDDIIDTVFQKGRNIVSAIADGIRDGISMVNDAIGDVTDTVSSYLPSSPADQGPLADNPPGESGETVAKEFGEGLDSMDDGEFDLTESVEADTSDIESDVGINSQDSNISGSKSKTVEINVSENAINIGPFEGLADEEVVDKVNEEVDQSFEQLVEDLRAKGIGGE